MSEDYLPYLDTLRLVPDDIILSMATRPISLDDAYECVCGWAAREIVARDRNLDAADQGTRKCYVIGVLEDRLGGENHEWSRINGAGYGPTEKALERAFVERVLEAVNA